MSDELIGGKMEFRKEFMKREIGGEFFLVPVGADINEEKGLFFLSELGAFIWGIIPTSETEADIVSAVLDEYEVDEETATTDVAEFISKLREMQIL